MGEALSLQAVGNRNCHQLIKDGIRNGIANLSREFSCEVSIELTGVRDVDINAVADVLEDPEKLVIAIYLTVSCAGDGRLMIVCEAEFVYSMLQLLRGGRRSTMVPLTDRDRLNLGKVCSVIGTALVNALENALKNRGEIGLHSGSPVVVLDRAGVILDLALAEILKEDSCVYVLESKLSPNASLRGRFLIMMDCAQVQQLSGVSEELN